LSNQIKNKEYQLIELKNQISEIEKSFTFKIMKKIANTIDSSFPNRTKRGELKKIVANSASMIERNGMSEYVSAVKTKIKRREFKVLEPMNLSEPEQKSIINEVRNNRKNRLKIKPHTKDEIKKDEFILIDEEDLI